jgi:nucleoside-diphosphate-sugar epimerase
MAEAMKTALVCGAGGFIGSHLVNRLKQDGLWVRGVDLKHPEFAATAADDFVIADLSRRAVCADVTDRPFDEVYQLAADMGGAGYLFTGEDDAAIMRNSALINLHMLAACRDAGIGRIFYSSSACIYPEHIQSGLTAAALKEDLAYPADPDSEYGWEKLFAERLYLSYRRNHGVECRIARFHNIFGPEGAWKDGREKVPAALCRKVATAADGGEVEIWGDGEQTRTFLYIDECIEGVVRLTRSDFPGPLNIGSEELVSINQLAHMIADIAGKSITLKHVPGPQGVRGRKSHNELIGQKLGWQPTAPLRDGLERTYQWIAGQVSAARAAE